MHQLPPTAAQNADGLLLRLVVLVQLIGLNIIEYANGSSIAGCGALC